MSVKKILLPFDGSASAKNALKYAVFLAGLCEAEIGVLNVVDLNKHISKFEQVSTGGYIPSEIEAVGYSVIAIARQLIPANIKIKQQVIIGSPAEVITDVCWDQSYDLIIMGSRGWGTVKQLMLGSVSHYVLHHVKCPVTVVR